MQREIKNRPLITGIRVMVPVLVLFAVAIVIVVNLHRIEQTVIRDGLRLVQNSTGARLSYGRVEGDIRSQLEFYDVSASLTGGESLRCGRAAIGFDLWGLIRKRYVVSSVELDSPTVYLTSARATQPSTGKKATTAVTISAITLVNGRVFLSDTLRAESIALTANLALDSTGLRTRVSEGRIFVSDLRLPVRNLTGKVAIQGAAIIADSVTIRTDRSEARLGIRANPNERWFMLDLNLLSSNLAELSLLPAAGDLAPGGELTAQGRVKCQLTDSVPFVTGDLAVKVSGPRLKGYGLSSLAGKLSAQGSGLDLQLELIDTTYGRFEVSGDVDWHRLNYSVTLLIPELNLQHVQNAFLPASGTPGNRWLATRDLGTLSGVLNLEGTGLDHVRAELNARVMGLPFDTISLKGSYEGKVANVELLEVRRSSQTPGIVRLSGRFTRETLDVQGEAVEFPIDSLGPYVGAQVAGVVSGKIAANGSYRQPTVSGQLTTKAGRISGFSFSTLSAEFDVPETHVLGGKVHVTAGQPALSGTRLQRAEVTLDHGDVKLTASSDQNLNLVVRGAIIEPAASENLAALLAGGSNQGIAVVCSSATVTNHVPIMTSDKPFEVRLNPQETSIQGLETQIAGGRLQFDLVARSGADPIVALKAESVDLHEVGSLLGAQGTFAGIVSFDLASIAGNRNQAPTPDTQHLTPNTQHPTPVLTGTPSAASGDWIYTGSLQATGLTIAGLHIELDKIAGGLRFSRKEVGIDNLKLIHGPDTSNVAGSFGYSLEHGFAVTNLNLHANLTRPGIWVLAILLKPTFDVRKGDLYGDVTLTGTLDNPQLSGQARIYNGELFVPDVGLLVAGLNAQFVLDGATINIVKIGGQSGGGQVTASGRIELAAYRAVKDLTLNIHAASVELHLISEAVAIASGDLNLSWANDRPMSLSGTVVLDEALITSEFGAGALSGSGGGLSAGGGSSGGGLRLNLKITADRNVWLRNSTTDLELGADLTVVKNAQGLSVLGDLTTHRGSIYLLDHSFQVTNGVLHFDNPQVPDPTLDVTAQLATHIHDSIGVGNQSRKIIVNLTGTASKPVVTLSSDPPGMSETDITYYLATNITPEEMSTMNNRSTLNAMVSDRLLSFASHELSAQLQKYLPVDVLELQSPSLVGGGGLKITVGKYIGTNLFVSYTASTTQLEPDAFSIEYFIKGGHELVGERTEDGLYNVRWQYKLRY